jgi:periplasmic protein TonB
MPNTSVFCPEVEVENNSSGCVCETRIQVKPLSETRRRTARLTEARLGEALLERHRIGSGSRLRDALGSLLLHAALIGGVLLLPLWYTDTLDLQSYTRTLLVGPPPPPPPPAPVATVKPSASASRRNLFSGGTLLAPVAIPKQVVILKEAPMPGDADLVGVPGGVPGGQLGGVIGGVLGGIPTAVTRAPAPPAEKVRAPIRVGGRIRAPQPIYTPPPDYPVLAKHARIQGDVVIDAVIDKTGSVVEMKVVSGQLLLVPAALATVRIWKYEPTYLNDEPIDVEFIVTVHFELQN